jgi:fatty acid desaturase
MVVVLVVLAPFFILFYLAIAATLAAITSIPTIIWFMALLVITIWGGVHFSKKLTPKKDDKIKND